MSASPASAMPKPAISRNIPGFPPAPPRPRYGRAAWPRAGPRATLGLDAFIHLDSPSRARHLAPCLLGRSFHVEPSGRRSAPHRRSSVAPRRQLGGRIHGLEHRRLRTRPAQLAGRWRVRASCGIRRGSPGLVSNDGNVAGRWRESGAVGRDVAATSGGRGARVRKAPAPHGAVPSARSSRQDPRVGRVHLQVLRGRVPSSVNRLRAPR